MKTAIKTAAAALLLAVAALSPAKAQKAAIKTNLLYWATGTINVGSEVVVGPKVTLDVAATGNPWVFGRRELNRKIWHWSAMGEARLWQTEAFNRGFVGLHMLGGSFDAGGIELPWGWFSDLATHRYEGWMAGAGVSYGWQWWISPHWNLEATLGVGYIYMEYNRFDTPQSSTIDVLHGVKHYFGPTRLGVSFVYLFGSKK